jgi:YcaO-like protein with predicted kinase domain
MLAFVFAHAGFATVAWDITSAVAVPAFHCVILDTATPDGQPGTGSGCHPDKKIALVRSILEAVQVRAVYISGAREDIRRSEFSLRNIQAFRDAFDGPFGRAAVRDFAAIASTTSETVEEDITLVLNGLRHADFQSALAVDLSRPDVGLPVVRILVPGLRNLLGEDMPS